MSLANRLDAIEATIGRWQAEREQRRNAMLASLSDDEWAVLLVAQSRSVMAEIAADLGRTADAARHTKSTPRGMTAADEAELAEIMRHVERANRRLINLDRAGRLEGVVAAVRAKGLFPAIDQPPSFPFSRGDGAALAAPR